MFYETKDNRHGLRHDPFKALVVPRPIGWISTVDKAGAVNLAPYSFFNAIGVDPPMVVFSSGGRKDTITNAEATGEFVCILATEPLAEAMNLTSAHVPATEDEMRLTGLTPVPSRLVKPPRIAESPVALECVTVRSLELPGNPGADITYVCFGRVVGVHIDDAFIREGRVDTAAMRPVARLGYMDYAVIRPDTVFSINRPRDEDLYEKGKGSPRRKG